MAIINEEGLSRELFLISPRSWSQASGGHSLSASHYIMPTLQVLITGIGRDDWCSINSVDVPIKQRALSKVIDQASFNNRLLDEASDTCTKALALSIAIPHAGDWLHVVPSSALGLHLNDQEFCHCLQYWLEVPM